MKAQLAAMVVMLVAVEGTSLIGTYNVISSDLIPPSLQQVAVSPGIIPAPHSGQVQPHPAVVENAIAESQLPPELLNPFYKNPAIAAGLAKESWFTNKEFPVYHREAEKIPRSEIFKIISRLQHRRR